MSAQSRPGQLNNDVALPRSRSELNSRDRLTARQAHQPIRQGHEREKWLVRNKQTAGLADCRCAAAASGYGAELSEDWQADIDGHIDRMSSSEGVRKRSRGDCS